MLDEVLMSNEAIYIPATHNIRFAIYPDGLHGARIVAEISEHALCTVFRAQSSPSSLIAKCRENFSRIQAIALAKYARAPQMAICVRTSDFESANRSSRNAKFAESSQGAWPSPAPAQDGRLLRIASRGSIATHCLTWISMTFFKLRSNLMKLGF